MAHLWDSFVLWQMWLMSTLKASYLPHPPLLLSCRMNGESAPHWSDKVCLWFCIPPHPPHPPQPINSQLQTLFSGERGHLKCPVQLTAAAPGPRHSSAQKTREGQGLGAPLCRAPPVAFLLFVPIDEDVEVLAVAFCMCVVLVSVCTKCYTSNLATSSASTAHTYRQVCHSNVAIHTAVITSFHSCI